MEDLLRSIMIENPNLPIKFFVGEDSNRGDYPYEENSISKVTIDNITLYNDEYMDEEELAEEINNHLDIEFESEEELNRHIDKIIKGMEFKKTVCIYLG